MKLLKIWWFWVIIILVLIILSFTIYLSIKKEINMEEVCGTQGCLEGCSNNCVPWEVGITLSCPAPTEVFKCECISNKCIKINK